MNGMRVATVVGARPQFIKAAAVSRILRTIDGLEEVIVHTGQHYDEKMSDVFFEELEIHAPGYNLDAGSGPHGAQTARMLEGIERVLIEVEPDVVVVYGDTNSTLAGVLAAVKLHIPVAHVEAGLRSFNRRMPEEINRIVADHTSDLLFAPTELAVVNLRSEGIADSKIVHVGDVMYDAAVYFGARAAERSSIVRDLGLTPGRYALATVHRAENTDERPRLAAILDGLRRFSATAPVILPLHPRTRKFIADDLELTALSRALTIIDPIGYLDMTALEKTAGLIATDSGGVQKEAFFHGVPCVTLRDETEWLELLELGWNRLCPPTSSEAVFSALRAAYGTVGDRDAEPYGDPDAAHRIVERLVQDYGSGHLDESRIAVVLGKGDGE